MMQVGFHLIVILSTVYISISQSKIISLSSNIRLDLIANKYNIFMIDSNIRGTSSHLASQINKLQRSNAVQPLTPIAAMYYILSFLPHSTSEQDIMHLKASLDNLFQLCQEGLFGKEHLPEIIAVAGVKKGKDGVKRIGEWMQGIVGQIAVNADFIQNRYLHKHKSRNIEEEQPIRRISKGDTQVVRHREMRYPQYQPYQSIRNRQERNSQPQSKPLPIRLNPPSIRSNQNPPDPPAILFRSRNPPPSEANGDKTFEQIRFFNEIKDTKLKNQMEKSSDPIDKTNQEQMKEFKRKQMEKQLIQREKETQLRMDKLLKEKQEFQAKFKPKVSISYSNNPPPPPSPPQIKLLKKVEETEVKPKIEVTLSSKPIQHQSKIIFKEHAISSLHVQCPICLTEIPIDGLCMLVCNHAFHLQCFRQSIIACLNQKQFPLRCPVEQCRNQIPVNNLQQFLDRSTMDKYYEFTFKAYVEERPRDTSWCPTAGCSSVFQFDQRLDNYRCPACKKHYCLKCMAQMHHKITCEEYRKIKDLPQDERTFMQFVKGARFKQCPNCKFWVQKNEGCDHMTCRCKYEFCYVCGGKYGACRCVGHGDNDEEDQDAGMLRMNRLDRVSDESEESDLDLSEMEAQIRQIEERPNRRDRPIRQEIQIPPALRLFAHLTNRLLSNQR